MGGRREAESAICILVSSRRCEWLSKESLSGRRPPPVGIPSQTDSPRAPVGAMHHTHSSNPLSDVVFPSFQPYWLQSVAGLSSET